MLHAYCANIPKNIVMASSIEDDHRIDELMEFLFTNNLLDHYAMSSGMNMEQWEANKQMSRDIQCAFSCDVSNGIFEASTQEQHEALMRHLHRLHKYGMLNKQSKNQAEAAIALKQPSTGANLTTPKVDELPVPSPSPTIQMPVALGASTPPLTREQLKEEFIRDIKSRYDCAIPLRLSDALTKYCALGGRKVSKDERSRIKILSEHTGDLFLHEYSDTHFTKYKNAQLSERNPRTLDEQIGLARRIYKVLIEQRVYFGKNPLEKWKPSVSANSRKLKAASSIASIDRIASVFGSKAFAEFGLSHPAYYLIIMTAVVTGMRITSICRLQSPDLLVTLDGIPVIDIFHMDKSLAGKRQVPIPQDLFTAVKAFLDAHGGFGIEDRGEKGCSDAIRELNDQFFAEHPNLDNTELNPHKLRTALNCYLINNGIAMDTRCALLGHSLGHVNNRSYSSGISTPALVIGLCGIQDKILTGLNFNLDIAIASDHPIADSLLRNVHATPLVLQ
jgi:integrase